MRLAGAPGVEAEDKFIEVGLEVLAAQPVIDAQGPELDPTSTVPQKNDGAQHPPALTHNPG